MPRAKAATRPPQPQLRTAVETPQTNEHAEPLAIPATSHAIATLDDASVIRSRLPASAVYVGNNVNTAARFCRIIFESGNAGKGVKNAETVFLKVMRGFEIGIGPLEAQSELHAIDGKIGCSGKLLLKKIREAGVRHEWLVSTDELARVRITLPNGETFEDEFSIEEADRAGLLDKQGSNYTRYPKRMLRWRALSFVVNGNVPELVAGGMLLAEELGAKIDPLTGAIVELPEQAPRPQIASPAKSEIAKASAEAGAGDPPAAKNEVEPTNGSDPEPVETVKRVEGGGSSPGTAAAIRKYAIEAQVWNDDLKTVVLNERVAGQLGLDGADGYTPTFLADQVNAAEIIRTLQEIAKEKAERRARNAGVDTVPTTT